MKTLILSLATFVLGVSNSFGQTDTSAFRYDTVPNPAKTQSQQTLYKIEQPVKQQQPQTYQSKPAQSQQPLSYSEGHSSQGRMVFGGTFGLAFGSNYSSVNISPQVGYEFNRYFTAGGGIAYFYYKNDLNIGDRSDFSQNYLGANVYAKFSPIRYISFQVQPEIYQMWGSAGGESIDSQTVPAVLAGGGVNIPAGRNGAVSLMVYYDLVQDDWSPYGNQMFYSIGYTFGF